MLFTEFNMEDALDVRYGEGISTGQKKTLIDLVKKGKLTIEEAAEELAVTAKEFQELMK